MVTGAIGRPCSNGDKMSKRYFANTAKLGAESEPIGFYYQWGSTCQNCGKHPIGWVVVFSSKNGEIFGTGTECARHLKCWGKAYTNLSSFKKKVRLYALLTNTKLSDIRKKKIKIALSEIDELIKQEIEAKKKAQWDAQAGIRKQLLPARNLNKFTQDVLSYAENGGVMTERQIQAIRKCIDYAKRKAGSVQNYIDGKDIDSEKMKLMGEIIDILLYSNISMWFNFGEREIPHHSWVG